MRGYAATLMFGADDLAALECATRLVEGMPEDGRSCHVVVGMVSYTLAREVPSAAACRVQHGRYGIVDHSWIVLPSGTVLDVYAPGRYPSVQLVDARTITLPECESYQEAMT